MHSSLRNRDHAEHLAAFVSRTHGIRMENVRCGRLRGGYHCCATRDCPMVFVVTCDCPMVFTVPWDCHMVFAALWCSLSYGVRCPMVFVAVMFLSQFTSYRHAPKLSTTSVLPQVTDIAVNGCRTNLACCFMHAAPFAPARC